MELRHLRYFVAVAEELHFRRAAERLFMAQPPLSQQIHQLEDEIGVRLFERTNRRVALTAAGEAFLIEAHEILARIPSAVEKARRASRGEMGWFGVGFVASATYDVLPTILRRFREQYADVELVLLEIPGVEQWQALREKRIHIGFMRLQSEVEGMAIENLTHDTLVAALPIGHRLSKNSSIRLTELENDPFILYPHHPESSYAEHIVHLCEMAGFSPRIVQKTGEIQTTVSLVDAGIGVAIVPAAAHNLRRDGVVYIPIVDPTPTVELSMGYRQGDSSPILPNFLRIARETVKFSRAL